MNSEKVALMLSQTLEMPVVEQMTCGVPPAYPYIAYSIASVAAPPKGTVCREQGRCFWQIAQKWSFTICAEKKEEAAVLAHRVVAWFVETGKNTLTDLGYAVGRVGEVQNRDTLLTAEVECREGIDVELVFLVGIPEEDVTGGWIETVELKMKEKKRREQDA